MAVTKYTCPPQSAAGSGTFSNNLVGFQLVQGGGFTQGNFQFTNSITEKSNRNFETGVFSNPISLESLNTTLEQSRSILSNNFQVFPNIDLTEVTSFTLYGPLNKRLSASIEHIVNYFPAALEISQNRPDFSTGVTANNIIFDTNENLTEFEIDVESISNPFGIDFTTNSTINLSTREIKVSDLRNLTVEYPNYILNVNGENYNINNIIPTNSLTAGTLTVYVEGNPFNNNPFSYDYLIIRPNDDVVNKVFNLELDYVDNFILDRSTTPIYTAQFTVPLEGENGNTYNATDKVTWPLFGQWNLDIYTDSFTVYLEKLNEIAENFDSYKTNLIARFLVTDSLIEFDTTDQKLDKVLKIYGRSFDETKVFIDALANMTSINYNIGNDIPSQLLKNLAQTLGWNTDISPITNDNFLDSLFTTNPTPLFDGISSNPTPDELNYQYFRNLIMNSAYLFKSKGTRKSIEGLLRLIGAPEAIVEFNETVYVADQKININEFNQRYELIAGGSYIQESVVLDPNSTYSIQGNIYTAFTLTNTVIETDTTRTDYPVDNQGYPSMISANESYYFQIGAGWFESTPSHRSSEVINYTTSVFTGQNFNVQTQLTPFTYGYPYLQRYANFPYLNFGFGLQKINDNKKSWVSTDTSRINSDAGFNSDYYVGDDRLVLNVKNVDLYLNPAQGLLYDVWYLSQTSNFPIPNTGLPNFSSGNYLNGFNLGNCNYTAGTNVDSLVYCGYQFDRTVINPKPQKKTFFEFAQDFIKNMINVRDRLFITDGKTGGYPKLQSIFWQYLLSEQAVNIPTNQFSYQNLIEYVEGLGDYWIRLIEQMVPATTIWNTGVKLENSIFHRQKYVYRRQQGCEIIPVPCETCNATGPLFSYDCNYETISCPIYPWDSGLTSVPSFGDVLYQTLNNYLSQNGLTFTDCDLNSLYSVWYVDINVGGNQLIQQPFFEGYGLNGAQAYPTQGQWSVALNNYLPQLNNFNLSYYISNSILYVQNLDCGQDFLNQTFKLNVGINFSLACN
jgi:hypothetical protein